MDYKNLKILKDNTQYKYKEDGNNSYIISKENNTDIQKLNNNNDCLLKKIINKSLEEIKSDNLIVVDKVSRGGIGEKNAADRIIEKTKAYNSKNNDNTKNTETEVLKTGNIVAFLGYKDETLMIRSRFSSDENDFFLQHMMKCVFKSELPEFIKGKVPFSYESLLDFLILGFPACLKTALKKGIYKTYVKREYNDLNVKGYIDVPRHIKKNVPFTGKIAYTTREMTLDNHVTELIRHTIEYIKGKDFGRKILNDLQNEIRMINEVTSRYVMNDREKILRQNKKQKVIHSYFHEYRELQELCIKILEHKKNQFYGEKNIYGVLLDVSWLWEEYINSLIGKWYDHPDNREEEGGYQLFEEESYNKYYYYFYKKNEGDKPIIQKMIYPDFLSKEADNPTVIDAKYKPFVNIDLKDNGSDLGQMFKYIIRFRKNKGVFVYPETDPDLGELPLQLKDCNDRFIILYPFRTMGSGKHYSDYKDYEDFIKTEEEKLKKRCEEKFE